MQARYEFRVDGTMQQTDADGVFGNLANFVPPSVFGPPRSNFEIIRSTLSTNIFCFYYLSRNLPKMLRIEMSIFINIFVECIFIGSSILSVSYRNDY